jgi:Phosphotransferase enzyme family
VVRNVVRFLPINLLRMVREVIVLKVSLSAQALGAVVTLARRLRLPSESAEVLSDEQNLVVHLAPAPVVARVATMITWSRPDPEAWLGREVSVANHGARHGGAVVPPADDVDPGPHMSDGFAVTLWPYVEHSTERPDDATVGGLLAKLHSALADYDQPLPDDLPVHYQIENGLAALEREQVVDQTSLRALRRRHERRRAALSKVQGGVGVIHGDAHPQNILHTAQGWLWTDLEETGRGPRAFDLAVMASKVEDPEVALSAYSETSGTPQLELEELAPFIRVRELETVIWALGMAHLDPDGYRDFAQERLGVLLRERD